MKKEELTALGLTEEQIKGVQTLNGKDIEAHKNALATAEKERDDYKGQVDNLQTQLTTANDTISKFGDATPESIEGLKADVVRYKADAENAQKKYDADITQRDQSAWLNSELEKYTGVSPLAKKAIIAEVTDKENGLPWRNGAFLGFGDYMKAEKEKDNTLYQTEEEIEAANAAKEKEDKAPSFAEKLGDDGSGGKPFIPPKVF